MTEEQIPGDSPTIPKKAPTNKTTGKGISRSKKANSPTVKQGSGLNKIKQDELLKWTVFVQPETKSFVSKAAAKAGLTVTDWLDSRLREAATTELTNKPKPPAKVEDVADIVKEMADGLKASQEAATKAQNELIERQGQQLEQLVQMVKNSQPKSIKEMLFGKKNQD